MVTHFTVDVLLCYLCYYYIYIYIYNTCIGIGSVQWCSAYSSIEVFYRFFEKTGNTIKTYLKINKNYVVTAEVTKKER